MDRPHDWSGTAAGVPYHTAGSITRTAASPDFR